MAFSTLSRHWYQSLCEVGCIRWSFHIKFKSMRWLHEIKRLQTPHTPCMRKPWLLSVSSLLPIPFLSCLFSPHRLFLINKGLFSPTQGFPFNTSARGFKNIEAWSIYYWLLPWSVFPDSCHWEWVLFIPFIRPLLTAIGGWPINHNLQDVQFASAHAARPHQPMRTGFALVHLTAVGLFVVDHQSSCFIIQLNA